jgi:hypothetical protein
MSGAKFSSERPKGDAWGIEDAIAVAFAEFEKTGQSPVIPCFAAIGIKGIHLGPGNGKPTRTPVVQVLHIDALTTPQVLREAQMAVLKAVEERTGQGGILPFEAQDILERAFGGVGYTRLEQDDREAEEDALMDDPTRMRRHLSGELHGYSPDIVNGMEWADVAGLHERAHTTGANDMVPHGEDSWAWRQVDVDDLVHAAEAEGEDQDEDSEGP